MTKPSPLEADQDNGASACGPTGLSSQATEPDVSALRASIPSAGSGGPDWFAVARGLANAIMFQRSTRGEHTVGRDGRVRMGMVDLLGCYIVDDAAREFCEMAGLPFGDTEVPNEHQAFYMALTGRKWLDWFTERDAIVDGAGPSPGRGKVDLRRLAQAIEARQGQDPKGLDPKGESAVA